MRLEISEFEKVYALELLPVTQLCGQNIRSKSYVVESIRRYFGTFKYQEEKNKWRDNVKLDGELVGRKYFTVISIKDASDLLSTIKWTKTSLMMAYVKQLMQHFEWQTHLRAINDELDEMFRLINENVGQLGDIELNYEQNDIWDIVQKSSVTAANEMLLDDLSYYKQMEVFLNLIEEVQKTAPKKLLVIFENLDHYTTREEYKKIIQKTEFLCEKSSTFFIFTTSLDGYVKYTKELCEGITIFNEIEFQMPEYERMEQYVGEHYPSSKMLAADALESLMERIIHRIAKPGYLVSTEENVLLKIINQTLMMGEALKNSGSSPEIAFLKA